MNATFRSLRVAMIAIAASCYFTTHTGASENPDRPVVSAMDASSLADHVGKEAIVEGVVSRAGRGPSDGVRFLNFGEVNPTGFVVAIFPSAYSAIDPVEEYVGKTVRITGELQTYKERIQIKVTNGSQLEVVSVPAESVE